MHVLQTTPARSQEQALSGDWPQLRPSSGTSFHVGKDPEDSQTEELLSFLTFLPLFEGVVAIAGNRYEAEAPCLFFAQPETLTPRLLDRLLHACNLFTLLHAWKYLQGSFRFGPYELAKGFYGDLLPCPRLAHDYGSSWTCHPWHACGCKEQLHL